MEQQPPPDEYAVEPPQRDELENGQADDGSPPARRRDRERAIRCLGAVPAVQSNLEVDLRQEGKAHDVDQPQQQYLHADGVAHAHGRSDGVIETLPGRVRDQLVADELAHACIGPAMHYDFGPQQQGQCRQQAYVHLDIPQERQLATIAAPCMPVHHRQQHQGQPRDCHQHHGTPVQQLECIPAQACSPPQLVQRATEHQGEIGRVTQCGGHARCIG